MKTFQADQIKNIALLGNSGSGKTTLAEAMLFMAALSKEEVQLKEIIQFLTIVRLSMKWKLNLFDCFVY